MPPPTSQAYFTMKYIVNAFWSANTLVLQVYLLSYDVATLKHSVVKWVYF